MPQSFLKAGEHRDLVARLDVDHPVGIESGLRDRGREQVGLGHAPQHLPVDACEDARGEQRGGGCIDRACGTACDLVQRAQRQSATRQAAIHGRDPERQHGAIPSILRLDARDPGAQLVDGRAGTARCHGASRLDSGLCSPFVL